MEEIKIGERIKEQRKGKGWTQKHLATLVNVSPQVISNWERDYTSPDHDDIARLSEVLEVSSDYLLGKTRWRTKEEAEYVDAHAAYKEYLKNQYPEEDDDDLGLAFISGGKIEELTDDEAEYLEKSLEEYRKLKAKFLEGKDK